MRTRLYGGVGGEFRKILPYPDIQDLPVIREGGDPERVSTVHAK